MRVEIKVITEYKDKVNYISRQKTLEKLLELNKTFFPLVGLLSREEPKGPNFEGVALWTGSIEDFLEYLNIRESFGKEFEPELLSKAYAEFDKKRELQSAKKK